MLRGHAGSLDLIRGIFNPLLRRHFTATSVRCTDDNDRKKVEGVFSWLKDIFKSEVRVEEARNSIDVQIKDTPKGCPRTFVHNIQSCSSPEVASKVEKIVDAKISSTTEIIGHFGWYPNPLSRNLLLVNHGMDTQVRGVANCSPRNTKPPIREPNMPEKQQRKDDKEKKKKKKKPVLRTDPPEQFADIIAMEVGQALRDNPDVNFRYQWGIKIPEETTHVTQNIQRGYVWSQASNPVTGNDNDHTMRMTTSDTEKATTKAESGGPSPPSQPMDPGIIDESVEIADKREPEKSRKKVSGSSKDNSNVDEDYNIPMGSEFDAEISAWKDLVLKSKLSVNTNKDEFLPDNKTSSDYLSIRPEPPVPKLDVQAIPSTNEDAMKDDDEEDIPKELKGNAKKLDSKRTGDVQKIDSKKLHTSQSSNVVSSVAGTEDHCSSTTRSRESWTWSTMSGLPTFNVMAFSTSSEDRTSAEKINDTKGAEAPLAGKPTSPDNVDLANVRNMEEAASPDQQQQLRNTQQYHNNQSEVDSEFEDSRIANSGIEMSLQSTQEEHDVDDDKMNMADKDSMAMEAEEHHQHPNSFPQFEDDYVSDYESMSLEPTIQEKSAKDNQKQEQSTDSDAYDNESQVNNMNNYVSDGEYIKVPGDPYPYSKQHFEKWRMSKEDIDIGSSFVSKTTKDTDPEAEAPVGDGKTSQIDNLPPARSISYDIHLRNQLSRGKGVPN